MCPALDARLRDRLAKASRWSSLGALSGSRDTQRMGRRVAVATPKDNSSSSGDESTPLEKGEPPAGPDVRTDYLFGFRGRKRVATGVAPSPRRPVDQTRGTDAMPVRIQSRPKGIRTRDARLPKGQDGQNVATIMAGSKYQAASRIWLDAGRELALRVIVDKGSRVSLV